jgi:N-methylhydantoinase A
VPLDVEAARTGLVVLAERLGLSLEACASGVLEISAWNQANALRQITVKRGLDVRDFTLTTFGGSGSLLLCRLVDILGLRGVLVPPNPGNVSAFGLLTVDVKNDYVRTAVRRHDDLEPQVVEELFVDLRGQAADALTQEGFAAAKHRFVRSADLRYFGQAFEVRVPVGDDPLDTAGGAEVAGRFHDAHRALYGYDFRDDPSQHVEWVNLRVSGIGPIHRPELRELPLAPGDVSPASAGARPVCFDADTGYVDTATYWRPHLPPGAVIHAPAIIEEYGSTVPLHPGFVARVDGFGNLLITPDRATSSGLRPHEVAQSGVEAS